jgi:predicted acylesterase/phospholipase RssA
MYRMVGFAVGTLTFMVRALAILCLCAMLIGCASITPRNVLPESLADNAQPAGFANIRIWGDGSNRDLDAIVKTEAPKMYANAMAAHHGDGSLVLNFLAISGGADDGAYGAGLLTGWSDSGTRPQFSLVTGISAGSLIAPFAFLGSRYDKQLRDFFTKYGPDDIYTADVLGGLLGGVAVADSSPLEHLIEKYADRNLLREIAQERRKGRILLIGTTNLDAQRPVLWDVGRIAMSNDPQALPLFRKILLASASIPGVFPPVRIEVQADGHIYDEIHVDGGVTQQVFLAPSDLAFGKINSPLGGSIARRVYVIRNGKITPEWQAVDETTLKISARSVSTLIKNEGIGDLYRIHSLAVRDRIDFNLATIPADFTVKADAPFDRTYMQALFDRGYAAARRGYPWLKTPPGLGARAQR